MSREEIIKDLMEGRISPAEAERLAGHDPEFSSLSQIVQSTSGMTIAQGGSTQEAWKKLEEKIGQTSTPVIPIRRYLYYAASAAAVLLVAFYFALYSNRTVMAEPGQRLTLSLPDGTEVILNAGTSLSHPRFMRFRREVELSGEAYFAVRRSGSFTVRSANGTVRVTGTEFNVFDRGDRFEVHCFEGTVEVTADSREVVLSHGLRTHREGTALSAPAGFDAATASAWRTGDFHFQFARLTHVAAEMERQFGVTITLPPGAEERLYTGYFSNKDLDEALELVFKPLAMEYSREGNRVTVR